MSVDAHSNLNDQISREAAEWVVEFRTGGIGPAGRRDFDAWLRSSPEHIRAFIEMSALWHEGGAIDPRRRLDVEALIARARSEQSISELTAAARDEATVSMRPVDPALSPTAAHSARGNVSSRGARAARWAVAASVFVVALAAALILRSGLLGAPTYTADVGARRSIVLPDGSKVLLDSRSRLRVSFTAAVRTVELLQGQALFYVRKNLQRPFVVHAGHTVVRDVGTVFDVNRLEDGTIVTVVEGRVAVATPPAAAQGDTTSSLGQLSPGNGVTRTDAEGHAPMQPIYLSAGEQLDVHVGHFSPQPVPVDVTSETAWTHGEVVLASATLPQVAQVFNRYSRRRLVAEDLGKTPWRMSGVFSTNLDFLIRYLRGRPDIVVTETESEVHIIRNPVK